MRDIDLTYNNTPILFKYSMVIKNTKFCDLIDSQFGMLQDATQKYTRNGIVLGTTATNLDGETFITDAPEIKNSFDGTDVSAVIYLGSDFHLCAPFYLSTWFRGN